MDLTIIAMVLAIVSFITVLFFGIYKVSEE